MKKSNGAKKSRLYWLRYSDSNTKFFHYFANSGRAKKHISALMISGSVCKDQKMIENNIITFYKQLHTLLGSLIGQGKTLSPGRTLGWKDLLRRKSKQQYSPWQMIKPLARTDSPWPRHY